VARSERLKTEQQALDAVNSSARPSAGVVEVRPIESEDFSYDEDDDDDDDDNDEVCLFAFAFVICIDSRGVIVV
jgi:hypothetical protein